MTSRSEADTSMPTRPRVLPALMAALLCLAAGQAQAADAAPAPPEAASAQQEAPDGQAAEGQDAAGIPAPADAPAEEPPLPEGAYTYDIPLAQLGARQALALRGVDGMGGLGFGVRADQSVVRARVKLDYTYSPALLPDLSHLKVLLNSEVAGSIALPEEGGGEPAEHTVDLPVAALSEFNRLDLQLIGHYTMTCEDPIHSSLWADVSNRSALELTVVPVDLPDDLGLLPVPFFDRRDPRPLTLPVVLAGGAGNARLEAAGTLASWFGALAGYRGATFPVSLNELPARGHAVVMLGPNAQIAGLQAPAISGPTVAVTANPNDPHGKLLLVAGRNDAEIKQAAAALAVGGQTLAGPVARITQLAEAQPRKPFDAPNWLRTDRPVHFGELVPPQALNVNGHRPAPIDVNLRLPPGLFGWRSNGVPVDLKYRYSPRPGARQSVLEVLAGGQLVQSFSLHPETQTVYRRALGMPLSEAEARLDVPTYMLPPLSSLQFRYVYEYAKLGECQNSIVDNIMSSIDPGSTIDISGLPRYAAMPDLAAFSDAGFPFTRMADLSETAVILPDGAGAADYSAYLALLGAMGESTGYPATHVTVAQAAQVDELDGKDLLVLASGDNQPLLARWRSALPDGFAGGGRSFGLSDWFSRALAWFGPDPDERRARPDRRLDFSAGGTSAVFAGLESPLSGGRSVVVVAGTNADGLAAAADAVLANRYRDDKIRGSLAVVRGDQVVSLLDEQSYYVGKLPPWLGLQWFFARHTLLLLAILLVSALAIAVLLYLSLRARAQRRLGS